MYSVTREITGAGVAQVSARNASATYSITRERAEKGTAGAECHVFNHWRWSKDLDDFWHKQKHWHVGRRPGRRFARRCVQRVLLLSGRVAGRGVG